MCLQLHVLQNSQLMSLVEIFPCQVLFKHFYYIVVILHPGIAILFFKLFIMLMMMIIVVMRISIQESVGEVIDNLGVTSSSLVYCFYAPSTETLSNEKSHFFARSELRTNGIFQSLMSDLSKKFEAVSGEAHSSKKDHSALFSQVSYYWLQVCMYSYILLEELNIVLQCWYTYIALTKSDNHD